MKKQQAFTKEQKHDQLAECIKYILAGFEGRTNGNKIVSLAIQQVGLSGYRIVTRAVGFNDSGDTVHLVGFTTGDSPGAVLLLVERGYRENLIQWKVDRFANSNSDNGSSKNEQPRLVIVD